jgi:hypothetical protein
MAQQTVVEWLQEQLNPDMKTMQGHIIQDLLEQAKQMEKENIINAYFEGFREGRGIDKIDVSSTIFIEDTNAERYYEATYQPTENHSPKEI